MPSPDYNQEKTMKKAYRAILMILMSCSLFAQSAEEIIEKVDNNRVVESISYKATMLINMGGKKREKSFEGYARGEDFAYLEFTAPARDRGTRFLMIRDEMWMYIPAVEKATKIAGHMLRQSLMGSDFSYDDFTENERLQDAYDIALLGSDTIANTDCYVLELIAKITDVNYYKRKTWISKDTYVPLKTELYAKSGKLMKEIIVLETKKYGARQYPVHIRMENKLRKNTFTELTLNEIEIDITIPSKIFTKAYLERK
jgi:outer membrane lipoprotein-sorting protein